MNNKDNAPNGKVTRVEMELVVDQLIEALPAFIRRATTDASLLKAKYDALLKSGFTEPQALHIVSSRPLWE